MNDEERFWSKVEKTENCWNWTAATCCGYGYFWIIDKQYRAHRISWILSNGPIPDGLDVLHKCDNRKCVNPDHLYLGTAVENHRDVFLRGKLPNSKLTKEQVLSIRQDPRLQREIAKEYGIVPSSVSEIKSHKRWNYLETVNQDGEF